MGNRKSAFLCIGSPSSGGRPRPCSRLLHCRPRRTAPHQATPPGKQKGTAIEPLFGLAKPSDGPFPADRFTLPDASQNTCRRV